MKLLFFFFVVLLTAVAAGLLAYQDPGYVLIGRGYKTVEMSLSLFVTLQILGFTLLYLSIRTILHTWNLPTSLQHWRQHRRTRRAYRASRRGLIELAEGHWRKAEQALIKNVRDSETPLLNYLSAARAAQKQHAHERRDHYLSMAAQSMPETDIAVELTQAELQLAHGQLEQALATLEHLRRMAPHHTHVLSLLSQLYERLQNWHDLQNLLPLLRKHKVLNSQPLHELSLTTYRAVLEQVAKENDTNKLQQYWHDVPKAFRLDANLLEQYIRHLIEQGQHDTAERLLRDAIKREWQASLMTLYGVTKSSQPEKQLATAEQWLSGRETNALLLLCLGRLSLQNQLWGKARSYFESSLGINPTAETYKELGLLLEQLEDPEKAAECYRKGLLLTTE